METAKLSDVISQVRIPLVNNRRHHDHDQDWRHEIILEPLKISVLLHWHCHDKSGDQDAKEEGDDYGSLDHILVVDPVVQSVMRSLSFRFRRRSMDFWIDPGLFSLNGNCYIRQGNAAYRQHDQKRTEMNGIVIFDNLMICQYDLLELHYGEGMPW